MHDIYKILDIVRLLNVKNELPYWNGLAFFVTLYKFVSSSFRDVSYPC